MDSIANWQDLAVYALIGLILLFVIYRIARRKKSDTGCTACAGQTNTQHSSTKQQESILRVRNMHCENCENTVTRALHHVEGITSVKASHQEGTVTILYNGEPKVLLAAREKLEIIGFPAEH